MDILRRQELTFLVEQIYFSGPVGQNGEIA